MSCAVFVPVLMLTDSPREPVQPISLNRQMSQAFAAGAKTPGLWLAGILEATVYVALYAMKAFLPIYALSIGINVALVGAFFALQELVVAGAKPFGGRFADQVGYVRATALGMLGIGVALPLLGLFTDVWSLFAISVLLGVGQALVFPATTALVAVQIDHRHVGAGMGLLGTLQNGGKVLGPVLGGLMVAGLGYEPMFALMGVALIIASFLLLLGNRIGRRRHVAWHG